MLHALLGKTHPLASNFVKSAGNNRPPRSSVNQIISPLVSMVWNRPLIVSPDISWTAIREPSVKANVSNAWRNCDGVISSSLLCSLLRHFAAIEPGQVLYSSPLRQRIKPSIDRLPHRRRQRKSLFAESRAIAKGTRGT